MRTSCPTHVIVDHPDNVLRGGQVVKLLTVQIFPALQLLALPYTQIMCTLSLY
jgi:hypothetical protein